MENRRTFLKQVGVLFGALTLDPSKLLVEHRPWVSKIHVSGMLFDDFAKNLYTVRFMVEDHPEALPGERYAHYCKIPAQAYEDWDFFQTYLESRIRHWGYDGSRAQVEFIGTWNGETSQND